MRRAVASFFALVVVALPLPSSAAPPAAPATVSAPTLCSLEEWQKLTIRECVDRLPEVAAARAQCLTAPNPSTPDSGFGGWFATTPTWNYKEGLEYGRYSSYGYAGYDYTTYDVGGCFTTLMHPDYKLENTIANGEFMIATGVVAGSNALRERAWDPGELWAWADPLVEKATRGIYDKVFTVFGVLTLAVIGMYLIWRSRRAEMSSAVTTVGWALAVMVAVTAIAAWPIKAAHLADSALISTLSVVHDAVGPTTKVPPQCVGHEDAARCQDNRPPAVRAGDTAVESLLYRNWIRGALGNADSETAKKYGPALYDAKSITWAEAENLKSTVDPAERQAKRDALIKSKQAQWLRVAEQIKAEDPDAYTYLQGTKGMERIGAGFVAILAAIAYALFDIVASLLVLLGFLVFRWAVVAAPALGTIGMMRPASAGIRRLAGAVLAAVFNIAIFGTGAAVYLSAVDLVMSTPSLPGWLQVTLVALCGVVGWMLLRPYRRITQLGGNVPANGWTRELLRPSTPNATVVTTTTEVVVGRPEQRSEREHHVTVETTGLSRSESLPEQRKWKTVDVPETLQPAIYRPTTVPSQTPTPSEARSAMPTQPVVRSEAR